MPTKWSSTFFDCGRPAHSAASLFGTSGEPLVHVQTPRRFRKPFCRIGAPPPSPPRCRARLGPLDFGGCAGGRSMDPGGLVRRPERHPPKCGQPPEGGHPSKFAHPSNVMSCCSNPKQYALVPRCAPKPSHSPPAHLLFSSVQGLRCWPFSCDTILKTSGPKTHVLRFHSSQKSHELFRRVLQVCVTTTVHPGLSNP